MKCYIYKSARRAETYVYLAAYDQFAPLPDMVSWLPLNSCLRVERRAMLETALDAVRVI